MSISSARSPPTPSRGRAGSSSRRSSQTCNPAENTLLPDTAGELWNLDIKLREVMVDGGFNTTATNTALP
jgi:hypothetical protein